MGVMGARRLPYREGTWFAVPLRSGGYTAGLVARTTRNGKVILCYFFGPRRSAVPVLADVARLTRTDAIRAWRIGDLHLMSGQWPILGAVEGWKRADWPMPTFLRTELLTEPLHRWRVEYDDVDPSRVVQETRATDADLGLEPASLSGAGSVELKLDGLLP
jgi:hypothetical protein